jgi:glutathione peroxidase
MTAISMNFAVFLSLNLKSNKIKMKKILFILMAFFGLFSSQAQQAKSIHSFKVKALDGKTIDFSKFKGKKILIVNTASECGFTSQ